MASEETIRELDEAKPRGGFMLRGTPVSPGLVLGPVHRKDYDILRAKPRRVPLDQVESELNRFHGALTDSRRQLDDLKARLEGRVPADHARILDTHVAYLKDPVFLSDVENLILKEQMALETAIAKVIVDFDRIFRLVENETLRERAVDLRDVGIRVLRNLERQGVGRDEIAPNPSDYVLVARELSIVDMFNLSNEHVHGIITEGGGLTSHAAILARSMRIPTLTGVHGLLDQVNEGDFVIVDATEGVLRVNPDEVVRAQYRQVRSESPDPAPKGEVPAWANRSPQLAGGEKIVVGAVCGNLPEVEQASDLGMSSIGLYRTELLYLIDREQPSVDALIGHYSAVIEQAQGKSVTFRLLDVDSSLEVGYLHEVREQNPGLGRAGVRALLAREQTLRNQLQAILRASAGAQIRIAIPFVTDCGELRRVKEILFEERFALRKAGLEFQDEVELGVVIETPVAALGARDLVNEAEFVIVSLDSLLQYLLAADRENHELRHYFDTIHPVVLRCLLDIVATCRKSDRPLSIFGVTAVTPANLPFLIGTGLRHFCVAPVGLKEFLTTIRAVDVEKARSSSDLARRASCPAETQSLVDRYRHGYARPS